MSEYYSGVKDEKFLSDWNNFVNLAKKMQKSYSMKSRNFHTYNELLRFYQDFENVLQYFSRIRYYLMYRHILDIDTKEIYEKIHQITQLSNDFLHTIAEIYQKMYRDADVNFLDNIRENIKKNPQWPYVYKMRKFLEECEFYKKNNTDFFKKRYQIESELSYICSEYE